MFPVVVLSLTWSIGAVSQAMDVGPFVVGVAEGIITPAVLPAIVFVSAAVISFSIGTSWGTMGILFPVVPLAYSLGAPMASAIGGRKSPRRAPVRTAASIYFPSELGRRYE